MKFTIVVSLLLLVSLAGCGGQGAQGMLHKGSAAPSVETLTIKDVGGDFSKITTYRYPDERMYQMSVAQALRAGKPIVLEFATPGHCTVCDNQLQMLKAMLAKYEKDVIFLHMDQYQNPQAFKAFRVIGDPWTFLIDERGVVQLTRPGRMLYNELDWEINKVLVTQTALTQ